jgi:pentatricopeptide repeat protein
VLTFRAVVATCKAAGQLEQARGALADMLALEPTLLLAPNSNNINITTTNITATNITTNNNAANSATNNTTTADTDTDTTTNNTTTTDTTTTNNNTTNSNSNKNSHIVAYTTLMTACLQLQRWEDAECVYHKMRAGGVEPNRYTHKVLLAAYRQGNQQYKAAEVVKEMRAKYGRDRADKKGLG